MQRNYRFHLLLSLAILTISGSSAIAGEECNSSQSSAQNGVLVNRQQQSNTGTSINNSRSSSLSNANPSQEDANVSSSQHWQSTQSSSKDRPRYCKDEDDTNCYSLVTLECR